MIQLILSLDYEIFGNGSGDVRRDMIDPTHRLLDICDRYGAKLTIMFEVAEYWAMKQAEEAGLLGLDYSPTRLIEEQVKSAVTCGHDVQLHLHPWWVGARFERGNWLLRPELRTITDLPNGLGCEADPMSVTGILCKGKRTLERIIRPVHSRYECLVYRAAMFWGHPSGQLIAGLKRAGMLADSSVVPGLHETACVPTDYRDTPSAIGYWWTQADDISQSGPKGEHIVELPVYSRMRPYICNLKWTKLYATIKRHQVEQANTHGHGMMEARKSVDPFGQIVRKLCMRQPIKYDFCKLSAGDMTRWLRRAIRCDVECGGPSFTPVVMLGHSKDFWNDRNLEIFLRYVRDNYRLQVRFSTLGERTRIIAGRDIHHSLEPTAHKRTHTG